MGFDHVEVIFKLLILVVHVLLENTDLPQNLVILIFEVGKPILGFLVNLRNDGWVIGGAYENDGVENLKHFLDLVRCHNFDFVSERWLDDSLQNVVEYILDFDSIDLCEFRALGEKCDQELLDQSPLGITGIISQLILGEIRLEELWVDLDNYCQG